jgi:hypothetical protein
MTASPHLDVHHKDVTAGRIAKTADPVGVLDDPYVAWIEEMIQHFLTILYCHSFVNLQYQDRKLLLPPMAMPVAAVLLPTFSVTQRGYIVSWTNCAWPLIQPTIQGVNQIRGQARSHLTSQES